MSIKVPLKHRRGHAGKTIQITYLFAGFSDFSAPEIMQLSRTYAAFISNCLYIENLEIEEASWSVHEYQRQMYTCINEGNFSSFSIKSAFIYI